MTEEKKLGRPPLYTDELTVRLRPRGGHRLQQNSDRRAVVNLLVEEGGQATLGQINTHFGFDISGVVSSLVRAGWVELDS